jgi:DNA-binding winged helix-turn-helix (wHTH) protein
MPDAMQYSAFRRFGAFEINMQSGELRKNGLRLRLSGQPFQVLAHLVESAGELVRREELRSKLWPADTFVDFDHGLNNAVARIREVLEDSSGTPRYIETVPRRGYRFSFLVGGPGSTPYALGCLGSGIAGKTCISVSKATAGCGSSSGAPCRHGSLVSRPECQACDASRYQVHSGTALKKSLW